LSRRSGSASPKCTSGVLGDLRPGLTGVDAAPLLSVTTLGVAATGASDSADLVLVGLDAFETGGGTLAAAGAAVDRKIKRKCRGCNRERLGRERVAK